MNKPETLPVAEAVVGKSTPHESAHLHVSGAAPYIDDLPEPAGTLHAALGLSPIAHGRLTGIDLARIRKMPGVVAVLSAADIAGENNCGPLLHDDPILAADELRYVGQPVFAVIATNRELARRAAALAKQVIQAEARPPVLTALDAHAIGQYVLPPMHLTRGEPAKHLASAPHRLQGRWSLGGQEQFYLEGQISLALPQEGGEALLVHCSTQHPSEMQQLVAHAIGWQAHRVAVQCRRMGGGFGGKESQSAVFACVAAIAALKLGKPVKLRVDRDDDFLITGRRHGFDYRWDVGFDAAGRILAVDIDLVANAGHSADLSAPVMARALCHFDNAYWLPHVAMHGYCAKTNTQSNTAFRGFGGPQGAIAVEMILDGIARQLGLDPAEVRQRNFYARGQDVTPYGQQVEELHAQPLTAQLLASSRYAERRAEIAAFNAASPVLKKGLAFTPVKFGISFNVAHLNQAGALVHVYTDGSVLVNHGGTEMGQGLNTKVAQVVAHELGLPMSAVRCSATDTSKVANTSATAASTGSDLNGKAAQDAARKIKQRLAALAAERFGCAPELVAFDGGQVSGGGQRIAFCELVAAAYLKRVQLWSDGFYATPGLHWDRTKLQGHPFYYYAWGGAVCEALVDTLTGESRITRADILHDVGSSLNPALDIGQIEGGFIQGMGWLTMEELVWHPTTGLLTTHAPSTYKIPTANDCPPELRVELFGAPNASETIHRSKAVGEPPLLLGFAALLAIKDACAACGADDCDPPLRAPATAEAVLNAIEAIQ
ncbi:MULTISPECIES: xanthine dehydrogenase molybdopterin binding subunit [unclassified Roseateles]|uniref:xanthine dehydrogenase molybdopterin binding subunit n=1 Tax=unclassified Roseateles TaxID=2626991 RepID=UPI0006FABF5C|nr:MULTISPECIES: xanthine dehydrogenase molybdopterin binding subunit [unclassified Roseateles]KQW52114.1 aldehyde oxidase [Pelomonas sp. Root405]KRA78348.1 aldehyde oxidase [Pelomonas sp. Root662]